MCLKAVSCLFDVCQLFLETVVSLYGYLEEGVPHIAAVPYLKASSEMISEAELFPVFFLRSFPRSFRELLFRQLKLNVVPPSHFHLANTSYHFFPLIIPLKALHVPIIS